MLGSDAEPTTRNPLALRFGHPSAKYRSSHLKGRGGDVDAAILDDLEARQAVLKVPRVARGATPVSLAQRVSIRVIRVRRA